MNTTQQIQFEIPTSVLSSLNQEPKEFAQQTRLWAAIQLFRMHRLTLMQASELAELKRELFLAELDKYDVPVIDYAPSELEEELNIFKK